MASALLDSVAGALERRAGPDWFGAPALQGRPATADVHCMRWTLWALLGVALMTIGVVDLSRELAHGSDIWRRHNLGLGLVIPGVYCLWRGLAERAGGGGTDSRI